MVQPLATERLRLDRWTRSEADVDFLFDLYRRWEVQQFLGTTPTVMQHRSEAVERAERLAALDHPLHGMWAITERTRGHRLGVLLLKDLPATSTETPLPPSGKTEIGWHLHPDAWGRGYATEAATRVLAYAFANGLLRVLAVTQPANLASQRVATRIGMQACGLTTRFYNSTCELFEARPEPG